MTTMVNKPVRTLRERNIEASIWRNETENGGTRYAVTFSKSCETTEGKTRYARSFSEFDLMQVERLAKTVREQLGLMRDLEVPGA